MPRGTEKRKTNKQTKSEQPGGRLMVQREKKRSLPPMVEDSRIPNEKLDDDFTMLAVMNPCSPDFAQHHLLLPC